MAVLCGIILLTALIAAELAARHYLGLGDPPLLVADQEIEYLYKPSTEYHRFGNRIAFNSYSMRSEEFPAKKVISDEFRVLVMEDSIADEQPPPVGDPVITVGRCELFKGEIIVFRPRSGNAGHRIEVDSRLQRIHPHSMMIGHVATSLHSARAGQPRLSYIDR